jgi:hypothetical protein
MSLCCLARFMNRTYEGLKSRYAQLYTEVGVPPDPMAPARANWPALAERPFTLVHADVHRKEHDCCSWADHAHDDVSAQDKKLLIHKLVGKLNTAYQYWEPGRSITQVELEETLHRAKARGVSTGRVASHESA